MKKHLVSIISSIVLICMTINFSPAVATTPKQESPEQPPSFFQDQISPEDQSKDNSPTPYYPRIETDKLEYEYLAKKESERERLYQEYERILQEDLYAREFEHVQIGAEPSGEREYITPTAEELAQTTEQLRTFNCSTVTDVPQLECEALVALYESTNGAGWTNNTNWLVSTTVDDWYGVTITAGHVTNLSLTKNQLSGPLPAALVNLVNLEGLSLAFNELSGGIPSWLGDLTSLKNLGLGGNPLGGPIPPELGNLVNLTSLMLFSADLTGSIPASLGNLTKLIHFHIHSNPSLTGSLPSELGQLTGMEHFWAGGNQFSGEIPVEFGNLTSLVFLQLQDNQLTGSIPASLGNLVNLEMLDLEGNQLTGTIPTELGSLVPLGILRLDHNQLSGAIPESLTNLVNLCLGESEEPCVGTFGLDLGYNSLNVTGYSQTLLDFLTIYDSDWYLTQAVTETIQGAIGGTIISNDGNTEVLIPPGAVEGDITFTFAPQSTPNNATGSLSFAGNSFELTAEDDLGIPVTTFGVPVTLTIVYDDSILGDIAEDTLRLYYWDTGTLVWLDAVTTCTGGVYTRDLDANWLSLPICHLSEFALLMGNLAYTTYLPLIIR